MFIYDENNWCIQFKLGECFRSMFLTIARVIEQEWECQLDVCADNVHIYHDSEKKKS